MLPDETAKAGQDLKAKMVLPDHNGKFALARHEWNEPYRELVKYSKNYDYKLLIPQIGQAVDISDLNQEIESWW